jgi:hypothetical protein
MILNYLVALALTILSEGSTAFLFGIRDKNRQAILALINLITNLSINAILLICTLTQTVTYSFPFVVILELVVTISEGFLFKSFLELSTKKAFLYSILLNSVSFLLGIIIHLT